MRSQFAFYKSFDDVYQDLNDKQKLEFMNTILDVQFLRVKIDNVVFKDVILKHIWNAQKHSIQKSVKGYLESQKNTKIKEPFYGVYDDNFTPLSIPSEGNHKEEQEKEEEKEQVKRESSLKEAFDIVKEIINYLNLKASTKYKPSTSATKKLIKARLNEKFTLEDFKRVIDNKCNDWLNTEHKIYIRPETLFGTKFESYLNQIVSNSQTNNGWSRR